MTSIGNSAFSETGWYNNQPDGILYLDNWLIGYKGNKPTGTLVIANGTKGIADEAFYGCSGLTSVMIPNSVTSIGYAAFEDCSGLTSVISEIIEPFYIYSVFSNDTYNTATLYVPVGTIDAYKATNGWMWFKNIEEIDSGSSLTLTVTNENGSDLTSKVSITWYDRDGKEIGRGKTLNGIADSTVVYYSVVLEEELGRIYREVKMRKVLADGKSLVCQLKRIDELTLHGMVTSEGVALTDVEVSLTQWLNGKYEFTACTKTDSIGAFTLKAYNDSTVLVFSATGYVDKKIEHSRLYEDNLGTIALEKVQGMVASLQLSYQEAVREGEEPIVQSGYSDTRNIAYPVRNVTKNIDIIDFNMQMGDIVLPFGSEPGDRIQVTLRSLNDAFAEVSGEGVINSEGTVEIALTLVAYGGLEVVCSQKADEQLLFMLYGGDGKLVSSNVSLSRRVTFTGLKAGDYMLVTMGYNSAVGSIGDLSDLDTFGLEEGGDYVKTAVTVQDGVIGSIIIAEVPELDASKFEYTSLNTSYLPNKSQMTLAGPLSYITLTARVDFKTQYANEVNNVKVVVDIPEGCEFVANSVVTGTKALPHTLNGNQLTITLSQEDIDSRIRFCMLPKQTGTFTSTAYADFDYRGEKRQSIGSAVFEATAGSIGVPSVTASPTIAVNGIAAPHATVDVYDGDQLIGTTTALGDGKWRTNMELYKPYNLSTHDIYAKYQTDDGIKATTESKECLYDMTYPKAKSVTMSFYNGWMKKNIDVVFNFETGKTSSTNYSFYTATNFTFVADLTANDTTRVNGVTFYVHTTTKEVRKLKGFFDEKLGRWVAVSKFDSYNLPVNLTVDVKPSVDGTNILVDRAFMDDGINSVADIVKEAKTNAAEIKDALAIEVGPLDNEDIYNELENLLSQDDYDKERADYLTDQLLNSIPGDYLDVSEEEIEKVLSEADKTQDEFEEWLRYEQNEGNEKLLSDLMLDLSVLEQNDMEVPFTFSRTDGETPYEFSARKLDAVSEEALLQEGYSIINMTDDSKIYFLVTSEGYVFVDLKLLIEYSVRFAVQDDVMMARKAKEDYLPSCINTIKNIKDLLELDPKSQDDLEKNLSVYNNFLGDAVQCAYGATYDFVRSLVDQIYDLVVNEAALKGLDEQLEIDQRVIKARKAWIASIKGRDVVSLKTYKQAVIELKKAEIRYQIHLQRRINVAKILKSISPATKELKATLTSLPRNVQLAIRFVQSAKFATAIKVFGKIGGGLATLLDIIELAETLKDACYDTEVMINLLKNIHSKLPCEGDQVRAYLLEAEILYSTVSLSKDIANIIVGEALKTGLDAAGLFSLGTILGAPASLFLWVASVWDGVAIDILKCNELTRWDKMRFDYSERIAVLKCKEGSEPDLDDNDDNGDNGDNKPEPPFPPITPIHDPSGYVYEAVPTNRVEGVTASIYFDQSNPTLWDADDFSQVNPQITDETGLYQWDVPQGMWQVRFEKSGYETTQTSWLPVPPPQLEINIPMSEAVAPTVVKASGMESGITLDFSKYMKPATLEKIGRVSATVNGKNANGDVEMLNLEEDPYNKKEYASKVKFVPSTPFKTTDEVVITVKKEVESYADKQMENDFVAKVKIEPEIKGFVCDSLIAVDYQGEGILEIAVLPATAAKGRKVSVTSTSTMIATTDKQSVTLDDDGKATITVNGYLPGGCSLHLQLDGTDIEKYVEVNVVMHEKVVKKPKASKRSGSTIEAGYLLWLTCNTPGATIYYTLDGSCPCDEESRIKYTEPFVLPEGEVTVKAIAVRQGMEDSDVATFTYTVEGVVGISDTKKDLHVDAEYADGVLTITGAEDCAVRVFDLLGRELASRRKVGKTINMQIPKAESYIISITTTDGQTMVRKVIGR